MVWTNDFDDLMNGFGDWYDPFDEVVSLVAPDKDEVETEKSIDRHDRKLANRYNKMLRHEWNDMMSKNLMKTDVKETDSSYELDIDLPGYKKEDVNAKLTDGYLVISASTSSEKNEGDENATEENGKYIRRERFFGSCSRSFYVGEDITEEDIKARFENGVLKISVPKKQPEPEISQEKYIAIEG